MDVTPEPARRFLAPVLTALTLALTVAGAFLPFYRTDQPAGIGSPGTVRTVVGPWGLRFTFPGQDEISSPSAPSGVSLLLASAILLAALVLASRQAATRRPSAATTRTALVAAAFLAGVVCTIVLQSTRGLFEEARVPTETTLLAGTWVLIAAVPIAAAGAIALFGRRRPEWADPAAAFADTTTPPSGVAITVLPPEDD